MGLHGTDGVYHAFRKAILFSLFDFREVDANSDVGAIAANGGILASDTTPIMRANAAETQEIGWAASNSDAIAAQKPLEFDFDGNQDVLVELDVSSGTTDPATFTCETGWDGGALVSDTITDGAKSATVHTISGVIAAADIPDGARRLSITLTPAAHTTDAIVLQNVRLGYLPKKS
jgi:hypothetical protein